MSYPYRYYGQSFYLVTFFEELTMKNNTNDRPQHVQLILSERVLAQWRHVVAFMKDMNFLHRTMRVVKYQRTVMTIDQQSWCIFHCLCFACDLGGCRGNTQLLVARWWRLVASMKAVNLLHRIMHPV